MLKKQTLFGGDSTWDTAEAEQRETCDCDVYAVRDAWGERSVAVMQMIQSKWGKDCLRKK